LVDKLRNPGPFTIFAPTETAFVRLPTDIYRSLFLPENENFLQQLLLYHVVDGSIIELPSDDMSVTTVGGLNLTISYENGLSFINDLPISEANVSAANGTTHSIDDLLMSEGLIPSPTTSPKFPAIVVRDDPTIAPQTLVPSVHTTFLTSVKTGAQTPVPQYQTSPPTMLQKTGTPSTVPLGSTNFPAESRGGALTASPADPTKSPTLLKSDVPTMVPVDQMDSSIVPIDDSFASVAVNIMFDDSPEEIGWLIQDVTDNSIVASQAIGTYSSSIDGAEEIVRLQKGVYLFGIEDAAGDGLCCDIPGVATVSIDGEVVGIIEGNFGSFEFLSFSVP
jgi:hypothetical protein